MDLPFAATLHELGRLAASPGIVVVQGPRGVGKSWLLSKAAEMAAERERALPVVIASATDDPLLGRADQAAVLVESRGQPSLRGARRLSVGTWPVPEPGAPLDELAAHPTVAWFAEAASLRGAELRAVAEVVILLEGVPELLTSAVERVGRIGLAALRELLGAEPELVRWYDERPSPLDPEGYTATVRRHLAALSPGQRATVRAAATFPSGFGSRALVDVAGARDESGESPLYTVELLLAAGLLLGDPREGRFAMPPVERAIVQAALPADPVQTGRFVRRMVSATGGPLIDASPEALRERPNMEAALRRAAELGDAASTLALTRWLTRLYLAGGPLRAATEWTNWLVRLFDGNVGSAAKRAAYRAEALLLRGVTRLVAGDHAAADQDLAAIGSSGTATVRALATSKRALILGLGGQFARADRGFREAEAIAEDPSVPLAVRGELAKDEANVLAESGSEHVFEKLMRARAIFRRLGHAREEAFVTMMLASRACDLGDRQRARVAARRALELFERVGDRRSRAWSFCLLGLVEQENGKFHRASNRLRNARKIARAYGDGYTAALATGLLGGVALEAGELDDALALLAGASDALAGCGHPALAAYFEAFSAAAQCELGRTELASAMFERAAAALSGGRDARRRAVAVLACGLQLQAAADSRTLDAVLARANQQVAAGAAEEVRTAWRIVSRQAAIRRSELTESTAPTLRIALDAHWFELGGKRVDLRRRSVLRAILRVLAERHESAPGVPTSPAELIAHVWQGERVSAASGTNRLYVAIARLRTEGLAAHLRQEGEGYVLLGPVRRG